MNKIKIIDTWVIISILVIIILIAINIPFITTETYKDVEFYTEKEPYTTTETYYEKEMYFEDVPLNITTKVDWFIMDNPVKDEFDLKATIKNIDTVGGEFWVVFHVETTRGSFEYTIDKVSIKSGESHQIQHTFSGKYSYVSYKVYQPTEKVMKYRNIPGERTVTMYRDVEKSRQVMKLKKINMSLLQRIVSVNDNR